MAKADKDKIMLTDHVLEVRHEASGTFLDVRGYVADYIRGQKFLPHWTIETNVINFRDESEKIKTEGAFVGYKSAGYVVLNPQTRNFFADRTTAFWKMLLKNEHYQLPKPTRFGTRTRVFVPSEMGFDEINKKMFEGLLTDRARTLIGGKETDLQFTIELKEAAFDVRLIGGPIHKDEAGKYFQFESDYFKKCGLFLDIDYYKTQDLSTEVVPKLLHEAVDLTWLKAERIATGLGF
jgi:hypothetical protein